MIKYIITLLLLTNTALAHYDAEILRVIDGDTVLAKIYLLPGQHITATIRLNEIDTPEKRSTSKRKVPTCEKVLAKKASQFTVDAITNAETLHVDDLKLGTYASRARDENRNKLPSYIGQVIIDGENLSDLLFDSGLAQRFSTDRQNVFWCK